MYLPKHFTRQQLETLRDLRTSDRRYLKCVFRDCQPPDMRAMQGEFEAELLHQGGRVNAWVTRLFFCSQGKWVGKAFRPTGADTGVGYNCMLQDQRIVARLPMDTRVADSSLDSGRSMIISYRARNWGLICGLLGEVRQVIPGVLLGMGLFGPKFGRRDIFRRKIPFVMVGPVRPYQFAVGPAADEYDSALTHLAGSGSRQAG